MNASSEAGAGAAARPARGDRRLRGALVLLLALSACAGLEILGVDDHPPFSGATPAARQQREAAMNQQWQNKPLDELIADMGRPKRVLNVPGGPVPPTFAVVYGRHEGTGCIDAFAISPGPRYEPIVRVYYCR